MGLFALVVVLIIQWILGAGIDVFEEEPEIDVFTKELLPTNSPLLKLDNVVVTPHVAGYSSEYLNHALWLSVESAIAFGRGYWPKSVVNPHVEPRWNLSQVSSSNDC